MVSVPRPYCIYTVEFIVYTVEQSVEPHWNAVIKRSKSVSKCNKVQQIRDFAPFERPRMQNNARKFFGGSWSREAMFKYSPNVSLRKSNTLPTQAYNPPLSSTVYTRA